MPVQLNVTSNDKIPAILGNADTIFFATFILSLRVGISTMLCFT